MSGRTIYPMQLIGGTIFLVMANFIWQGLSGQMIWATAIERSLFEALAVWLVWSGGESN